MAAVEYRIDGFINGKTVGNVAMDEVSSIAGENKIGGSSVEPTYRQDQDDNMTLDSSGGVTIPSAI